MLIRIILWFGIQTVMCIWGKRQRKIFIIILTHGRMLHKRPRVISGRSHITLTMKDMYSSRAMDTGLEKTPIMLIMSVEMKVFMSGSQWIIKRWPTVDYMIVSVAQPRITIDFMNIGPPPPTAPVGGEIVVIALSIKFQPGGIHSLLE